MRKIMKDTIENLIEVFVDCPLQVCEERDVK
jgi:adenylylsulfate kinase-like enzyme